ncbi:uncharacterized protein LOC111196328 [Astyanax mexicanus]|uniref:uncharacterized protein LOC125785639 n=1 Tax=Astyanax mexicanus TaxID=7994 RepID=UPI0020CB56E3|nr:uncharacterized protein LOC125785639 [Astyanax mexicanus]XP_049326429.1 uncharacterized protein LOC111196328 [Astyanax mexicanus]
MCPLDIESQTSTTSLPPLLTSPTHSLCLPPDTVLQPSTTLSIFPPIPLGPLTSTTHNIRLPPDAIPPITSTHSIVPSPDTMALTSPTRSISPPLYIATPATPTHSISSPLEPVPILSPTLEVDHDLDDHFMSDGIDVSDLLNVLRSQIDFGTCPSANLINVCRDDIMACAVRAFERPLFDPMKKIDIIFVDDWDMSEGAVDDGGPTREFSRLLMQAIKESSLFEGPENEKHLSLDSHGEYLAY